ncbi:Major phosphate-irrepressible acid phosphatase precursor [Yersinia massiliensis]|uniref:Acid phosphatase n=4 Tax=Yersiniaceae TaxID=1903411 RepID=A0A0T9QIZ3_9GAMM|nr:phosphatase PAP2 family protein [Yersinia frederiksenii]AVX36817.1 phosphatase PAP2 family protein [Yersinia massiliensis]CRY56903.1 Major phosphate-irrepressible acid phosphatase precursor [Yersinia intermedia]HEC1651825.1 phosphatase PAP2 family protein [Yersinia enterocolitica]NIL28326.1 phosphatase PAP2 family protein [Yersinia massiliensis]
MKKTIISTMLLLSLSGGVLAADDHYLTYEKTPDSLKLLPPPPSFLSVDFLRDKAYYDEGKSLRNTVRGKQAYDDADVSKDSLLNNFSEAFGLKITKEKTPQIYTLISTMKEDAGEYATRSAKKHYNRVRPFAFFNEATCRPEDEKQLSTNGSYPSGHTAIGWSVALVLAEINPARQDEILKRGYELGESRVICGYHWQSDVDAARMVASSVVATLHTNADFVSQLAKAKEEMKSVNLQANSKK